MGRLKFPPAIITIMLRDIADTFREPQPKENNNCECCLTLDTA